MSSKLPRVLIVDDSAFMRRMTTQIIEASGEFTVAGTARNGFDALKQIYAREPDIVTMDVDMPELDGLSTLGYIMSETPRPVIMLSASTTHAGHESALRALELGAVDFILKPSGTISLDLAKITDRLLGALRAAAVANLDGLRMLPRRVINGAAHAENVDGRATHVVAIASSTGGPRALAAIVPHLDRSLRAAVLVVQHMPAGFTKSMAKRLDAVSPLEIDEAQHGQPVLTGRVYIAPGGHHLRVVGTNTGPELALDDSPPLWGVRPAADVLFKSVAEVYGSSSLAVVLTGMGRDGAEGTRLIREAGGRSLIQDRESAAIFGMPQAAMHHAGADRVCSLTDIGTSIVEMMERSRDVS